MFICSVRASTLRFFGVAVACIALLLTVLFLSGEGVVASAEAKIDYTGITDNEKRIAFLGSFGWRVKDEVVSEESFVIPDSFDRVLSGYNEIQKAQGLDLSRYRKKRVTRYVYEVTNYEGSEETVYATLIVCRGRVIAADVSSADPMGFVHGLEK